MSRDHSITHPCVVFALRRESLYFRRSFRFQRRILGAPCRAEIRAATESGFAQQFVMLETGIGMAAMGNALRWCLNFPRVCDMHYRPAIVFLVGFSGALQSELAVGDTILATEILDTHGNRWPTLHPPSTPGQPFTLAPVLSVEELVNHRSEKKSLGQQYAAVAVDMESAAAARICHEQKVPLLCLRAISDDVDTSLSSHLVELLQKGTVSIPRLVGTVIRHREMIGELMRLARNTRKAANQLLAIQSYLNNTAFKEWDLERNRTSLCPSPIPGR